MTLSNSNSKSNRPAPLIVAFRVDAGPPLSANGREAQTLLALIAAGSHGITSLEAFKAGWAVRLAAYVGDLRKMGVAIVTNREVHEGGNHARYILQSQVEIVLSSDRDEMAVAA
jgi:hypothetical protein